ncbi:sensor histidine kinase [Desulfoluna limicola]|uniref:sensor histidine kinase n=1 Tax=Desulfoluna limicola TaxID=2810562 RepID=UPI001F2F0380|nr:ATP-binding protein [Desulfoluna limicola]
MLTHFAPAERLGPYEIREQSRLFGSFEMHELSASLPVVFLILNRCRQIVCANKRFVELVGGMDAEAVLGRRPGEALGCINAMKAPFGCGTHEFCSTCGAVKSILESQEGHAAVKECVISCDGGRVLELRVWATPIRRGNELFTIFSAVDISDENRRKILERTFFHDISNTAAGIYGTAELLTEGVHDKAFDREVKTILYASEWLIDEIRSHRKLMEAESGELRPQKFLISTLETLNQCIRLYTRNKSTHSRILLVAPEARDAEVETDPVLLRRILINMIKNALEATPEGGCVLATSFPEGGAVHFSVSNPGFMNREIQMGLFKRAFSTKGAGRGVGTYSMKLFAERYLGGTVHFTTSHQDGTTFTLSLPITHTE